MKRYPFWPCRTFEAIGAICLALGVFALLLAGLLALLGLRWQVLFVFAQAGVVVAIVFGIGTAVSWLWLNKLPRFR